MGGHFPKRSFESVRFIHNWSLEPSIRIINLVSHTIMLCVLILCISGGTYSLKSTPNDRFFEKLFIVILFTLRVSARNLLRGNRRRNNFHILFWCLAWISKTAFSYNKPTHYLLNHGVFVVNNFEKFTLYNLQFFNCQFAAESWIGHPARIASIRYNTKLSDLVTHLGICLVWLKLQLS